MSPRKTTRRSVLKAGVAALGLGATGSLAGCSSPFGGGSASSPPEDTPQSADFMFVTNFQAILGDEVLREEVNASLEQFGGQSDEAPQSVEAAMDQIEEDSGLDPRVLRQALFFGRSENATGDTAGEDYAGFVLYTDWAEEDVIGAIRESSETELQETTYAGRTIYESDAEGAFASLGDGKFVLGSARATRDVIDVTEGDADPVGGELRDAFDASDAGYMQFAADVQTEDIPEEQLQSGAEMAQNVSYVYGSVYADGDRRGVRVSVEAEDEDSATEIEESLQGLLTLAQQQGDQMEPETQALLENIEIGREGTTVTITNEVSAAEFAPLVGRAVAGFLLGATTSGQGGYAGSLGSGR